MKNYLILLALFLGTQRLSFSQTNTFPSTGKVGIGILSPGSPLHVIHDYGHGNSGFISMLGGKDSWAVNDWEGLRLGFTQFRSIYEGGGVWGLGIRTGISDGVGSEIVRITGNGKFGLGTSNPTYKLHVEGSGSANEIVGWFNNQGDFASRVAVRNSGKTAYLSQSGSTADNVAIDLLPGSLHLGVSSAVSPIQFWNGSSGSVKMTIASEGNVGIGTITPSEKLSVNGKIRAHEVKVETANWPDYVFHKGYSLKPLAEVDKFIKVNNHLPDVPSAQHVSEKGISLGEMDATLLKKIEELTLYLIAQDRELKELKEQVSNLKAKH